MPRPETLPIETAVESVARVYQELEKRPIERNCTRLTECCQFKKSGHVPFVTRGEALYAAKAYRAAGRTQLPNPADGSCPFLDARSGKCQIYAARPFGCRTHFCDAAGGPYPRREVADLIRDLEVIDEKLGGDRGRNLASALRWAMEQLQLPPRSLTSKKASLHSRPF